MKLEHNGRRYARENGKAYVTVYLVTRYYSSAHRRFAELLRLRERGWDIRVVYDPAGSRSEPQSGNPVRSLPRFTGVMGKIGLQGLERAVERRLFFPSAGITYVWNVRRRLERLIREDLKAGRAVCLVTYLPPLDLLRLGLGLKSRFPELVWVVDGHFPVSVDEYYWSRVDSRNRDRVRRLENATIEQIDFIVAESPALRELVRTEYGVPETRIRTIPHSTPALQRVERQRDTVGFLRKTGGKSSGCLIGYVGNLFKGKKVPGERILDAFDRLNADRGQRYRLRVVGDRHVRDNPAVASDRLWFEYVFRLPHDESFSAVKDCDCLLIALGDTQWSRVLMPAKLPYYLAMGLPILALVPGGSTVACIVNTTGAGWVVSEERDWASAVSAILRGGETPSTANSSAVFPVNLLEWSWFVESWEDIFRSATKTERRAIAQRRTR